MNRAPHIFQQRARRPRVLDELGHWELKCSVSKDGARRASEIGYAKKAKRHGIIAYRFQNIYYGKNTAIIR